MSERGGPPTLFGGNPFEAGLPGQLSRFELARETWTQRASFRRLSAVGTPPRCLTHPRGESAVRAGLGLLRSSIEPGTADKAIVAMRKQGLSEKAEAIESARELLEWAAEVNRVEFENESRVRGLFWAIEALGTEGEEGQIRRNLARYLSSEFGLKVPDNWRDRVAYRQQRNLAAQVNTRDLAALPARWRSILADPEGLPDA